MDFKTAVENGSDIIEFGGKKYVLTCQAELTNHVFSGWFGDVSSGEEYTAEWSAPAIDQDGDEFRVIWRFGEVKGNEAEPESYNWDNIFNVVLA